MEAGTLDPMPRAGNRGVFNRLFGGWRKGGGIETENRFALFHDADPVTGDDLDILGIVFEQVDLAPVEGALGFFISQDSLFLLQLAGQFLAAFDLGVKKKRSEQNEANEDEGNEGAVGLMPVFGPAAALRAELSHAQSLLPGGR